MPFDRATLDAYWLPPEPSPTSVTRARDAVAGLSTAVDAATHTVERLALDARGHVIDLADASVDGDDIVPLIAALSTGSEIVIAERQLGQLQEARRIALNRLTEAE